MIRVKNLKETLDINFEYDCVIAMHEMIRLFLLNITPKCSLL